MSLKAAIGIVENALNHRTVLATGCCVVPVDDMKALNVILGDLIAAPKIERRYANVYPAYVEGKFHESVEHCNRDWWNHRAGILCFTFKDGKPDTTVAPEWIK